MRPSNSGMATPRATSSGVRPASSASHSSRDRLDDGAWMTGTPSPARWGTSQSPSSPSPARPMASTVVTRASTPWARHSSSASTRPSSGSGRSE